MSATRIRHALAVFGLMLAVAVLSGCVAYPAGPGYAYYAPGYAYVPSYYGYYAAPRVSVGVGIGCCWNQHGWWGQGRYWH